MTDRMALTRYLARLLKNIPAIVPAIAILASMVSPSLATQTKQPVIPSSVQIQLDTYIKRYIDWYEAEYCTDRDPDDTGTCRGTEYKKARRFCVGDIDRDGTDDIAVLYTIVSFCCGNNSQFKLVASIKVGGKGERWVEFNEIKGGKILLNTDEYLPDDPMCCPSGKGRTTYSLKNGKLVESDRVGEKPRKTDVSY